MISKARQGAEDAMRECMRVWDRVYTEGLKRGPHNPNGTPERAEQLARAYMNGWLTRNTRSRNGGGQ